MPLTLIKSLNTTTGCSNEATKHTIDAQAYSHLLKDPNTSGYMHTRPSVTEDQKAKLNSIFMFVYDVILKIGHLIETCVLLYSIL